MEKILEPCKKETRKQRLKSKGGEAHYKAKIDHKEVRKDTCYKEALSLYFPRVIMGNSENTHLKRGYKMAKKTSSHASMSKRHVKAGKIGGMASHICRGSECTKLRKAAAELKKARGYSAEELLDFLGLAMPKGHGSETTAGSQAKKAVKKAAVKRKVKKTVAKKAVKKAVAKKAIKKAVVKKAVKKAVAKKAVKKAVARKAIKKAVVKKAVKKAVAKKAVKRAIAKKALAKKAMAKKA